jgi:hypothetical protein
MPTTAEFSKAWVGLKTDEERLVFLAQLDP